MNRTAAIYGTLIVVCHAIVTLVHALAHFELHVDLSRAQVWFVLIAIAFCPLLAMGLLWTSRRISGLVILTLSMSASLLFGLYHHFLALGPDYVGEQIQGRWATIFALTAYGILLTEAFGMVVGLWFLFSSRRKEAEAL